MNLYVAVMTFTGHADNVEEFTRQLFAAIDSGDKDAQRVIRSATPTIIGCGKVETDDLQ